MELTDTTVLTDTDMLHFLLDHHKEVNFFYFPKDDTWALLNSHYQILAEGSSKYEALSNYMLKGMQ